MINPRRNDIEYAALTKLIDIVEIACTTNKRAKREDNFNQGGKIFYFLNALTFDDYIEDSQINNILECLKETAELYDYPVAPLVNDLDPPTVNVGPIGPQGPQGERGEDGGATDFTLLNASTNSTADEFAYTLAYAARWDVLINGTAQRAGTVWATWLEDGSNITFTPEIGTGDLNGSTSGIELTVTIVGNNVRLNAIISTGTWTVTGSRYLIPNNGSGVVAPSSLANGAIWIGNASNSPVANTITGDISISNTGVAAYTPLSIVNGDISASAAIAVSKLAAVTASRAVVSDSSGYITTSAATATEVGYLSGVTSNIQTQLDSKLSAATGAISTVVSTNLTASRAVVSDPSGKIAISGTTSTELGYLSGVTSAIQTQLNTKITGVSVTLLMKVVNIGDWDMNGTNTVTVAHGLADISKIRGIEVMVRSDDGTAVVPLNRYDQRGLVAGMNMSGAVLSVNSTNVTLARDVNGQFQNDTNYNATGYNRGWVTITYEA